MIDRSVLGQSNGFFETTQDHPTALEKEISSADAPPFHFFDPISCSDTSASFAGSQWSREGGLSSTSGSPNLYRQLATGILMAAERILSKAWIRCIAEVAKSRLAVYSAEAKSSIHNVFQKHSKGYIASEYFAQDGLKRPRGWWMVSATKTCKRLPFRSI